MKHIDENAQRKLRWLYVPSIIVLLVFVLYAFGDINIFESLFGLDVDVLEWLKYASAICICLSFLVYAIIAIRQKCWGELAITAVIMTILILNLFNVFVPKVV